MDKFLTLKQLAARWCMEPGTLRNWKSQGKGPKAIKIGGKVLYPVGNIEEYENEKA